MSPHPHSVGELAAEIEVRAQKAAVAAAIDAAADTLIDLARTLYEHPETAWNEHESAATVAQFIARHGFTVEPHYLGLETAIRAVRGAENAEFNVGFIAEYDALPGLGHACGHNLISAIALGASLGLAEVATELNARVQLLGCPAEEGGGGKIEMLDRGGFVDLDIAMMAHPGPDDVVEVEPLAVSHLTVEFRGKTAHAGAYPFHGTNAADAMVVAQTAIGMLRQQLPPYTRVHGVVTDGGAAPNAIPDYCAGRWYVRSTSLATLLPVEARVLNCFRAGALAAGCEVEITHTSGRYSEFANDSELSAAYTKNITQLGRTIDPDAPGVPMARSASTDMANVSLVVPALHPYLGIGCFPVVNHQPEFAAATITPAAHRALLDGAKALAWTAVDWLAARQHTGARRS